MTHADILSLTDTWTYAAVSDQPVTRLFRSVLGVHGLCRTSPGDIDREGSASRRQCGRPPRGLHVLDGALIPGTFGARNPSMTIAAVAERAMDAITEHDINSTQARNPP